MVAGRRPLLVPFALSALATATGAGLTGGTGIGVTAHAGPVPSGMPWHSPNKVTSGVPAHVASIATCPAPPKAGDSVLVQVFLSFGQSGGSGQILPANADGSWAGDAVFNFSGVPIRQTAITATCLDFTGVTGIPYAQYRTRHTQVFS